MKLSSRKRGGGFYEAFSDLIFAALAIFVLLMTVFMLLIHDIGDVEALERQKKEAQAELERRKERLASEEENLKELENAVEGILSSHVEIVFAVDATGSMQEELNALYETVRIIGDVLPEVCETARIGVVAYRTSPGGADATASFPVSDMGDPASYKKLAAFTRKLKAQKGPAPADAALSAALDMFTPDFTGRQVFMLIGDVGPFESRFGDYDVSDADRARGRDMVNAVSAWHASKRLRHVLTLFSGADEIQKSIDAGLPDRENKYNESRELFRRIALTVGQEDNYTENTGKMLPYILGAALKP